jgi:hypothetical protein
LLVSRSASRDAPGHMPISRVRRRRVPSGPDARRAPEGAMPVRRLHATAREWCLARCLRGFPCPGSRPRAQRASRSSPTTRRLGGLTRCGLCFVAGMRQPRDPYRRTSALPSLRGGGEPTGCGAPCVPRRCPRRAGWPSGRSRALRMRWKRLSPGLCAPRQLSLRVGWRGERRGAGLRPPPRVRRTCRRGVRTTAGALPTARPAGRGRREASRAASPEDVLPG